MAIYEGKRRDTRNIANKTYRSLSSCASLSAPAAAPVLVVAAPPVPKPNPPAIMHIESEEPYNALETSENIKKYGKSLHRRVAQDLQQCQCLPVLPRSRSILQSRMSKAYNGIAISGKQRTEKKYCQQSLSSCSHLSTPAAALVFACAAPKPLNPPT
jgi:hypothetical protein